MLISVLKRKVISLGGVIKYYTLKILRRKVGRSSARSRKDLGLMLYLYSHKTWSPCLLCARPSKDGGCPTPSRQSKQKGGFFYACFSVLLNFSPKQEHKSNENKESRLQKHY